MDKLISFVMAAVIVAVLVIGATSVRDLNDGRVLAAVQNLQK